MHHKQEQRQSIRFPAASTCRRVIHPPTFIVESLERLLAAKRRAHPELVSGPVTLDTIAAVCRREGLGLAVMNLASRTFGATRLRGQRWQIVANRGLSPALQVWAAAHQLAHMWIAGPLADAHECGALVLARDGHVRALRSLGSVCGEEYEADWIARRLVAGPVAASTPTHGAAQ